MKEYVLERSVWVPRPLSEVFPFFAAAENLERITPPELGFKIRSKLPIEMRPGALIDYLVSLYGIPMKWRTEISQDAGGQCKRFAAHTACHVVTPRMPFAISSLSDGLRCGRLPSSISEEY